MGGGVREPGVVAAHALDAGVVVHRVGRIRHADLAAAGEERVHQLPLGRHHDHVQRLGGHLRHGDQAVGAQVVDGLDEQIHDHPRLAAWRDGGVFGLLDRLLPVIAEAHLARRLQHLLVAPGKFLLGERDQLLRRVRNHGLGQILNQAFAAARRAWNPARVGLPRRIGIELQVRARDLRFAGAANEEVVHLRVARQLVEVERLQRRQPARVERDVTNRTAGRATPAPRGRRRRR